MTTYNPQRLEMEAQMFWDASLRFHRLALSDVPDIEVERALNDIEVIQLHTEWPPLKARCDAILDPDNRERETA